jgi:L,D-peptidoglycan transpeptidase YkuD (ErfK/YbiS/YcfS/YnhG family)
MAKTTLYYHMMRPAGLSILLLSLTFAPAVADERLPAYLIRLPETVKTAFVAETTTARFHRFDNAGGKGVVHRGDTYMSIGQNGDRKQRSGDRKTPLGIYFVSEQLDTSRMHEKYGYTAFTLDYPNALDRRHGRTGTGIWVHGVDRRGGQRPRWDTDGCIALPNDALAELESLFQPNVTPVLVSRTLEWLTPAALEALGSELEAAVGLWVESQERGDLHAFLSLYDEEFRHWGMNKTEWVAFQVHRFATRPARSIEREELLLLADPVAHRTYLSRFRMQTREPENTVTLTKRLYWRRDGDGALKLIAEDSG